MNLQDLIRTHRDAILSSALSHGVENIRLFGSVARGQATIKSDIDLLVHMQEGRDYFDLVDFQHDIKCLFQCKMFKKRNKVWIIAFFFIPLQR